MRQRQDYLRRARCMRRALSVKSKMSKFSSAEQAAAEVTAASHMVIDGSASQDAKQPSNAYSPLGPSAGSTGWRCHPSSDAGGMTRFRRACWCLQSARRSGR